MYDFKTYALISHPWSWCARTAHLVSDTARGRYCRSAVSRPSSDPPSRTWVTGAPNKNHPESAAGTRVSMIQVIDLSRPSRSRHRAPSPAGQSWSAAGSGRRAVTPAPSPRHRQPPDGPSSRHRHPGTITTPGGPSPRHRQPVCCRLALAPATIGPPRSVCTLRQASKYIERQWCVFQWI